MHNHGIRALAATIAVLTLLLGGCRDDDERLAHAPPPASGEPPQPAPAPDPSPVPEPPSASAATVEWLAPLTATDGSTLTNLAGYRIYYGTDVTRMTKKIEVKNVGVLTYVIEGLTPATYYFAVTAVNVHGQESARSNAGRKIIT
jgi:fibronectin type III domain protein